jgi:serine/threonine protein kinase
LSDIVTRQGAMQAEDACQVMLQVLSGLEAAHSANVVHGDLRADDIVLRKGRSGQLVVKILDFGRLPAAPSSPPATASRGRSSFQADIHAVGAILYEMLTGRAALRQGRAAQGQVPEVAQSLVPAIPQALARVVDQALASGSGNNGAGIATAKQMAEQLAPFAISDRVPSLVPRETLMPFLSQEARKSRGMARLERAVLGIGEPRPSQRPNLIVIEGSQDNNVTRLSDRPSRAPAGASARSVEGSTRSLDAEDLIEPRIPRPPRTPRHFGSVPRLIASERDRDSGHHRRRSSPPFRRWRASRHKYTRADALARPTKPMNPLARRIWSAGLLAAAGLGVGLLLARLLHF